MKTKSISKTKKLKPWIRRLIGLFFKIAIVVGLLYMCFTQITGFYYYRGNYMFPAVKDGDLLILDRISEIILNDVVVYRAEDGEQRVGRIVAKSGDFVSFTDSGELLINGCLPSEEIFYASTPNKSAKKITYPYEVKEDEYFILNDYRTGMNESFDDSRTYGSISADQIEGKVTLRIQRRGF